MNYRVREDCRLCGSRSVDTVLELPETPLANEFPTGPVHGQEEFPLRLVACGDCGHVQLPVVVDPERLFRDYVYVAGTSPVFVDHFRHYAKEMIEKHGLQPGDLVVEIGSNDGTLLRFFKEAGMRVLGLDPARGIATRAAEAGIETWCEFFDADSARRVLREKGPARLVLANNVFAHADDLTGIARTVKSVLTLGGAFVFEVSYLPDVIAGTLFDTIYHEHLSYHSIEPLIGFFRGLGMSLFGARRVDTHGGSVRVTVTADEDQTLDGEVISLVREEHQLLGGDRIRETFKTFAQRIDARGQELRMVLDAFRNAGLTIAGYGAPAKATTLLKTFALEGMLDFVVDDSPHKQGRWMPGGYCPVFPRSAIEERRPDVVLILAWNFAESIHAKLSLHRLRGGKCVVPLPTVWVL